MTSESTLNEVLRLWQKSFAYGNCGAMNNLFLPINSIQLKISCKKDATVKLDESIPYGLAVTLEVKEDVKINVYQKIKVGLRTKVAVQPGIN